MKNAVEIFLDHSERIRLFQVAQKSNEEFIVQWGETHDDNERDLKESEKKVIEQT